MKYIGTMLILCLIAVFMWIGFIFRPWMRPGSTFKIRDAEIGDWTFQIWQRKNESFTEPFATALFARPKKGTQWKAFTLSHQDRFSPSVKLIGSNAVVLIINGNVSAAEFHLANGRYFRKGQTNFINEGVSDDPQLWWTGSANTN